MLRISCPARIHMGLLNLSGYLGRMDGGLGFPVEQPRWVLELARTEGADTLRGFSDQEHRDAALFALAAFREGQHFCVNAVSEIPAHVGLGSKTSLLLGISAGLHRFSGQNFSLHAAATALKRGGTSGIGVNVFEGGLVWDTGHACENKKDFLPSSRSSCPPPKPILRTQIDWLDVVHFRFDPQGPYGSEEVEIFRRNCPLPHLLTQESLAIVAGGILPAITEKDHGLLQRSLSALQETGFKSFEWREQKPTTLAFRKYWSSLSRPEALCLSSMGPTMYVLTHSQKDVVSILKGFDNQPVHIASTPISQSGVVIEEMSS